MQIVRNWSVIVCAGLATVAAASAQSQKESVPDKPHSLAKVGQPAPDFTLVDCTGKKVTLAELKDKVVVLQWVNQECPWSVKAIPAIKEVQKKHAGKGIVWLGIDSTFGRTAEEDANYIKDKELNHAILMDTDGKVGHSYGAKTTPHVFVLNKGTLVYMGALHNNQQGDKKPEEVRNYLDEALSAVLAGKEVPLAETTAWGCRVKYQDGGKRGPRKAAEPEQKDK
jgi:peroxiredoxin